MCSRPHPAEWCEAQYFSLSVVCHKDFVLLLSGFKLLTWSSVFTIVSSQFHEVDQALIFRDIFGETAEAGDMVFLSGIY
jgi:hypothetical protein